MEKEARRRVTAIIVTLLKPTWQSICNARDWRYELALSVGRSKSPYIHDCSPFLVNPQVQSQGGRGCVHEGRRHKRKVLVTSSYPDCLVLFVDALRAACGRSRQLFELRVVVQRQHCLAIWLLE